MSTYLLTCQCGKAVPVEVGQAGGQVTCSCGQTLDVPTLRHLRHLPVAEQPAEKRPRTSWNINKGFLAAGLIIAGILAAYAAWNYATEPTVPTIDWAAQQSAIDQEIDQLSPLQGWNRWIGYYQPLANHGFPVLEHRERAAIEQQVSQRRMLQATLLVVAAVIAVAAIAVAYLWPRQ